MTTEQRYLNLSIEKANREDWVVSDLPLNGFLQQQGVDPMCGRIAKMAVGSVILAISIAGAIIGREAKSSESMFAETYTVAPGDRPFRDQSHFTTSIDLKDLAGSYLFPTDPVILKRNVTVTAKFFTTGHSLTGPPDAIWDFYSNSVGKGGKRMFLVLIAKIPIVKGVRDPAAAAGTGTILITTTDTSGAGTTTNTSFPVECIDVPPAP